MGEAQDRTARRAALLAATLSSFLTPFMGSAVNVALPVLGREWHLDAVTLSWITTSYLLAAAVFLVPVGKLSDILGRRRVFVWGISAFAIASAVCGFSPSVLWLMAGRVLQGLGSAMIFGTGIAILSSVFPVQERGKVLGLNVSATYLGLSAGPYLGGELVGAAGWRSIFYLITVLSMAVLATVLWKLEGEWAEAKGERFDVVGSVIYGMMLLLGIIGLSRLPDWTGLALLLAGIAGLGLLVWWERRVHDPILSVDLFRFNRAFAFSNLAALIHYSATAAVGFLLSLYLQNLRGLPPKEAGLVLVSQPVMMALFSPLAGWLSDRIEARFVASAGMALTGIALLLLIPLSVHSAITYVVGCQLLLGVGFAFFSSPNSSAIMGSVERRFYGLASASLGTMRLIGQTLSMGMATLILALTVGQAEIGAGNSTQFLVSQRSAFGLFAFLCGLGVLASLARGNLHETRCVADGANTNDLPVRSGQV